MPELLVALEQALAPPAAPFATPNDWTVFASQNGFLPPADYRALLDRYGAGTFDCPIGRLTLNQPLHPDRTFLEGSQWVRDNLRGFQRLEPARTPPWRVYPELDGFLPFGADDTSLTVGWLTTGPPEAWTVGIDGSRDGWWSELAIGALELVVRWAQGDLGVDQLSRARSGGNFLATTRDEHWSGRTRYASIDFAPSASARLLVEKGIEWTRARVDPASLTSFGAQGDAGTPLHATLSVNFRPAEEAEVVLAIQNLARELGTKIGRAEALDRSPIWSDLIDGEQPSGDRSEPDRHR